MELSKRLVAVGLSLSVAGLIAAVPAGATVRTGEINCSSTTLLGPVAIRNPSTSHVTGPIWAAQSSAVSLVTKGGVTLLPRTVGPATIGSFDGLINKAQLVGQATTTVTTGAIPGLTFYYDPDLADAVPAVAMNGVATYVHALDGVLGPWAAPTVVVNAPLPLVGTPGSYEIVTTLDAALGATLPTGSTPGNPGGAIYTPDVTLSITNTGTTDGPIKSINTSTTLTANVIAPIVTAATTSCAPSAEPTHQINVQTDGGLIIDDAPVVACKPTNGTSGTLTDSKGWWSKATPPAAENEFAGSMKAEVTYDGCVAPDQKIANWIDAKTGDEAAEAVAVAKADIEVKGKHYGNCTDVDLLTPSGRSYGADTDTAYPIYGTVKAKWLTSALGRTKVNGVTAYVGARVVVDSTGASGSSAVTRAWFEAVGTVSKGVGVGGKLEFVAELDSGDADVAGIIACNGSGYSAPAVGVYYGKTILDINTGNDAVLSITLP